MSDYMTEQQQIEQLKHWWKEYGLAAITGIVLAVAIGFGWRFYQSYVTNRAETASVIYERMMVDVLNSNQKDASDQAHYLIKHFASTPYAELAAFSLAKQSVKAQKWINAEQHLQWIIRHGDHRIFESLAKLRLARIYLQQHQPQDALKILQRIHSKDFVALVKEAQGDVYSQLGQNEKAHAAYHQALNKLPENAVNRSLLEMKVNSIPK